MKNHLTWLRPDQGLPELNWERVLIITVDGAVATLPGIVIRRLEDAYDKKRGDNA